MSSNQIVLFCISLNNVAGGLEKNFIEVARFFSKKNKVVIMTLDLEPATSFYELPPGVEWRRVGVCQPHQSTSLKQKLSVILKIRDCFLELDNFTVIGFHHGISLHILLASLFLKRRVVISERNSLSLYNHVSSSKWNLHFLSLFFVDVITVQFERYKKSYPFFLNSKFRVIPNGVRLDRWRAIDPKERLAKKTIITVGRLCAQKQFQHAVLAFSKFQQYVSGWRLLIVGEGESYDPLRQLIKSVGMDKKILLISNQNDMEQIYGEASIFCTTSKWEGFPNAVAEALASGIPCIGYSDCDGVNQLVKSGKNGILVEQTEGHLHLLDGLLALAKNESFFVEACQEARKSMTAFDNDKVLHKWEELLGTEK